MSNIVNINCASCGKYIGELDLNNKSDVLKYEWKDFTMCKECSCKFKEYVKLYTSIAESILGKQVKDK